MSTYIPPSSNLPTTTVIPPEPIWRFSVEQYRDMIRLGILTADTPVELLEGLLIQKMPKNPPHRIVNKLVSQALESIIPLGWYVDTQEPIELATSVPEPDVAIIRGNTRDYLEHHPTSQNVAVVIEIADSTLEKDRTYKQRIYAGALIPIYWIVNLSELQIEVYTQPQNSGEEVGYQYREDFSLSMQIPVFIDGSEVGKLDVSSLFP